MEIQKTTLKVPDITCGGCANSIRNALGIVEGIKQVEVDVDRKTVSVEHGHTVSSEQIAQKLDDIGFPVGQN